MNRTKAVNKIVGFLKSRLTKASGFRAIGVFAVSLGTTLCVIYTNHYNYWEGTIYRTQTVDFNILSNLLSTKVSILLPKATSSKDKVAIADLQQVIDSPYGLFGIIITDCKAADVSCPNQKILFASQATVEKTEDGKQKLIPRNDYARVWTRRFEQNSSLDQVLVNSPYILLYNPPPLHQEWGFLSPREDAKVYFKKNKGNIIGRVYLLRTDRPSFVGELQKWFDGLLNDLLGYGIQTHASSRSLVYNAIVVSAVVTGLLVLFGLEFAYYLTGVAQENEAKAITDKLNTEQKLRNALDKVKEADQERQQSEKMARIAAEKSQQAIREKEEAEKLARIAAEKSEQAIREKIATEEAASAINQQAIREKEEAEKLARIAAEKSEQAIREKEEAEKLARIAAEKSEQAIREKIATEEAVRLATEYSTEAVHEKENAEEAARIASEEREQSRRREQYLYDAIEVEIGRATRELEEKVEALQRENNNLRRENSNYLLKITNITSEAKSQDESNLIYFELTEKDFYYSERRDLILDILKNVNNVHDKSRRYHLLQDLVAKNTARGDRESLKTEIHNLFRGYTRMNPEIRSSLERMGFEFISERNHYKIKFCNDDRYVVTFAKTPSDYRAGMNIARAICNLLL